MAQSHSHSHNSPHSHDHTLRISSLNKAFIIGIVLNSAFVVAEFGAGFYYDSLGLMSDAGHNLGDVASLILAMLAFRLSKVAPSSKYTYGLKKSTVLVSLLNAVLLLVAVGVILAESIDKLFDPQPVQGAAIAWVAGIGVVINGVTAWLFMKEKDKDLNVKGAYLHMAADALVSVGVVVSGLVISGTGLYIIDPIIGIAISVLIIYSTWGLLRDSIRLTLDGVPRSTSMPRILNALSSIPGIINVHHVHVWALSTTETALTAHVVVADLSNMERLKESIKHKLAEMGITHSTLEFELQNSHCDHQCD